MMLRVGLVADMEIQFFRDQYCALTPNGRPRRKPIKLVQHISQIENQQRSLYCPTLVPTRQKTLGLNECISSRPPLSVELLATPSPCTYTIPMSSFQSTTAGTIYRNNYYDKIDNMARLPTPCTYNIPTRTIGTRSQAMKNYPSFTMGREKRPSLARRGCEIEPSPCSYFPGSTGGKVGVKTCKKWSTVLSRSREPANNCQHIQPEFAVQGSNIFAQ